MANAHRTKKEALFTKLTPLMLLVGLPVVNLRFPVVLVSRYDEGGKGREGEGQGKGVDLIAPLLLCVTSYATDCAEYWYLY